MRGSYYRGWVEIINSYDKGVGCRKVVSRSVFRHYFQCQFPGFAVWISFCCCPKAGDWIHCRINDNCYGTYNFAANITFRWNCPNRIGSSRRSIDYKVYRWWSSVYPRRKSVDVINCVNLKGKGKLARCFHPFGIIPVSHVCFYYFRVRNYRNVFAECKLYCFDRSDYMSSVM